MGRQSRVPQGKEVKQVNVPKEENLAETKLENGETVSYDTSLPVYLNTKRIAGRVKIPLYEEVPKVKGYFKNLENPGESLTVPHRAWKGPIRYFTLHENQITEIPITLCDLLNNKCCYVQKKWVTATGQTVHKPILDLSGGVNQQNITKEIKSKKQRYQFIVESGVNWKPQIEKVA